MSRLIPAVISASIAALVIAGSACGKAAQPAPPAAPTPAPTPSRPAVSPPIAAVPTAAPPTARLGDLIRPVAYQLEIDLDSSQRRFRGRIFIDIALSRPASSVWLHGRKLTITGARLHIGPRSSQLTKLDAPADSELLGFSFGRTITDKRARLELSFEASFGRATGVFRQRRAGHWYAYTDFEPIDARAAFPCFDDPRFKAPWTVSLVVPTAHHGFSNTPQITERPVDAHRKRLEFATTPPLPTYLVAFAAGPFEIIKGANEPVPQRIIAFKGSAAKAKLALQAMPAMLRQLERYFGEKVPYRKIDLIAVPRFNGAMENPGLITVAEWLLLPDVAKTTADQRLLSLIVIAHELSHLWFGDLVTMDYWNELWMNEAFATWMSGKLVAAYKPSLARRLWELDDRNGAMQVDERLDARAIRQPIKKRSDILKAFDAITYRKGAAVLTMFEAWMGKAKFQRAIRTYIANHRHGTGTTKHLLDSLSSTMGADISGAMHTFLDQSGIPLVSTELQCSGGKAQLTLSQSRYLPLGPASRASKAQRAQLWSIPVCVRTGSGAQGVSNVSAGGDVTCTLLTKATTTVPLARCPAWIYPNAGGTGYYRFRMPVTGLAKAAARGTLSPRERLDLATNMDAMMRSGELPIAAVLRGVGMLARSANRREMKILVEIVNQLARSSVDPASRTKFARWVRRTLGKRGRGLGITARSGESDDDALMRPSLIEVLGVHGRDRKLGQAARRVFVAWLGGKPLPDATLARSIARVAGTRISAKQFKQTRDVLATETNRSRRRVFAAALTSSHGRTRVRQVVDFALAKAPLRSVEGLRVLRSLLQTPHSARHAWRALKSRGPALLSRTRAHFIQYLPLISSGLCRTEQVVELRTFYDNLLRSSSDHTEQAAHSVDNCARLGNTYRDSLRRYLKRL